MELLLPFICIGVFSIFDGVVQYESMVDHLLPHKGAAL